MAAVTSCENTLLDKLKELNYEDEMNIDEINLDLILYCILVNGLDKTKGKKFDEIKKEMKPLIKILKEMFCEFDKNKIYKERTFILPLRSPIVYNKNLCIYKKDFYIINNKENLLKYDEEEEYGGDFRLYGFYYDVKEMNLFTNKKDKQDKRKNRYCDIDLDYYYLQDNEEHLEYKL